MRGIPSLLTVWVQGSCLWFGVQRLGLGVRGSSLKFGVPIRGSRFSLGVWGVRFGV